jgi:RimJ/RimL family protein N-acetyltransferase
MFARTERLLLRPGWAEDAPALARAMGDEGIVRNLAKAPWPYTDAHAREFLARDRGAETPLFLIFRRTDGAPELIGGIGIDMDGDAPEFGYWLARRHWGQGYATEAGRAVIDIARHSLGLRRMVSGHFTDNPASGRVLEKLGFRPTGRLARRYSAGRKAWVPCRLFERELADADADCADRPQMMAA